MNKLSPQTLVALEEALRSLYWYKGDLRRFVTAAVEDPRVLSRLDWEAPKRETVSSLIGLLSEDERHAETLQRLSAEVAAFSDFSHLVSLDDGEKLAKRARSSVAALAKLLPATDTSPKSRAQRGQHLERLCGEFFRVVSLPPNTLGKALEKILAELFTLSGMELRGFRLVGNDLHGSFILDQNEYRLFAIWHEVAGVKNLDRFLSSLGRGSGLGLLFSLNGFVPEAVAAHSRGRPPFVLMDGADLASVLEGRVGLAELILRKRHHAENTGGVFLSVAEVLKAGPTS